MAGKIENIRVRELPPNLQDWSQPIIVWQGEKVPASHKQPSAIHKDSPAFTK